MIVIAVAVLYGAGLGLSTKPVIRAVALTALSVGAAQFGAIWLANELLNHPGLQGLAWTLQAYAGSQAKDLIPTVCAATAAALIAALVSWATGSSERRRRSRRLAPFEN